MNQDLENIDNLDGLLEYFRNNHVCVKNKHLGFDRSEHIVKRLTMAVKLKCAYLAPEAMSLRLKIDSLLLNNGLDGGAQAEDYENYLRERFSVFNFSDAEIKNIVSKLTADEFASLDQAVENSVVLLNSLPDVSTLSSCSGHQEQADKSAGLQHGWISLTCGNGKLLADLRRLKCSQDCFYVLLDEHAGDNAATVRYFQYPTEVLIKKRKLKNVFQLFEESKHQLKTFFGNETGIDINAVENKAPFKILSEFDLAILKLADKHAQENNLTEPEKNELAEKANTMAPSKKIIAEYAEFYSSEQALKRRNVFFNELETLIQKCR